MKHDSCLLSLYSSAAVIHTFSPLLLCFSPPHLLRDWCDALEEEQVDGRGIQLHTLLRPTDAVALSSAGDTFTVRIERETGESVVDGEWEAESQLPADSHWPTFRWSILLVTQPLITVTLHKSEDILHRCCTRCSFPFVPPGGAADHRERDICCVSVDL